MAGIQEYSTTAGSNSTINSINVAENCPVAGLNNAIRQLMADIRGYANDAEWFRYGDGDGTATVAYASSTSFTVAGVNVTTAYHAGRRVKIVAATPGTIYGTISSSSFSTNTTVNVTFDSGSLSNETITVYLGISSKVNTSVPQGSAGTASAAGILELATDAETITGTDTARATTPANIVATRRLLIGINTQTDSYTLVLTDAGKVVEMNKASANNLTVPPNSSVAFATNTRIDIVQYGAGQTTVVAGSGVTIRSTGSKLKLYGQYSGASLYKRATDEWVLVGDLAS